MGGVGIAYGWIVQNTGYTGVLKPGVVAGCYRVTTAGRRALRQSQVSEAGDDSEADAA